MENTAAEKRILEDFIVDNKNLDLLESKLNEFNIFEATGHVRHEWRHSNFLAFLLDPQQPHGFGAAFLKRFLKKVIRNADRSEGMPSPIDLDGWDLDEAVVYRERNNIDILIEDEVHKLAVIIENKIDSSEHSGQLMRYRKNVKNQHKDWSVIGIFLTRDRQTPESDEFFISIDYDLIHDLVQSVLEGCATTLGPDVKTFLNHYAAMLRRYIMSDSEIEQLCRKIYQAHRHALDRIFEYLPDTQEFIRAYCRELIKETERNIEEGAIALDVDTESKGWMKFFPKVWDTIPALKEGRGWTQSGRILLFEFENVARWLRVKLLLGPGPDALRQKIFQIAKEKGSPFKPSQKTPGLKWVTIYTNIFLKASDIEDAAEEDIKEKIRKHWEKFVSGDLPIIVEAVKDGMAK